MHMKKLLPVGLVLAVLVVINLVSNSIYVRFDVTEDQRYTLSNTTKELLEKVEQPLYIDVLLEGDFPAEFKKLQFETQQLLEQYHAINSNIIINFENPTVGEDNPEEVVGQLMQMGLMPTNIPVTENGKRSVTQAFPWAIANYGQKSVRVPLLINNFGTDGQENINKSVQQLEYNFSDAITKLTITNKKKIAILKGNGELSDKYMADFLFNLKEYYQIASFDFDSLTTNPKLTLDNLNHFDAAIIAKPTQAFSDTEKLILDQYIMNGGKTLWCIDKVATDIDSLQNTSRSSIALPQNLNLDDMFFKYGIRINYNLIQDVFATPITVQAQNGPKPVEWLYSPIVLSNDNHVINKNVNVVKFEFANQIDTLATAGISKTILLKSSAQSKIVGAPVEIRLEEFMNNLQEETFTNGNQNMAVLLEGQFNSVYTNRVLPEKLPFQQKSPENKMIVIADGDVINYTYANKKPLQNGIDPWTQQVYGNKDFLINCMNYLLDDDGIINLRGKNIKLAFLDTETIAEEKTFWQVINILVPIIILLLFGILFTGYRKYKYGK